MTPVWRVRLTNRATKQLRSLPSEARKQIEAALAELGAEPLARGTIKLADVEPPTWRVKAGGDFRIIFTLDRPSHEVTVTWVGRRGDAYRGR